MEVHQSLVERYTGISNYCRGERYTVLIHDRFVGISKFLNPCIKISGIEHWVFDKHCVQQRQPELH